MDFLDFDLAIEHAGDGYRAQIRSPAGEASASFKLPFTDAELLNIILLVGRTRHGMRRLDSPEMGAAKEFGGKLFNAVFEEDVRACLRTSIDKANQQGYGLRLRLNLSDAPELEDIPWEFLYYSSSNRFFALSANTPIVRYLDLPESIRPLAVKPPLHILVMISSPTDIEPLDVDQEMKKLEIALGDLQARGLVALERIQSETLTALQEKIRRGTYHIFHFIGHGGFDQQIEAGVLMFEDEQRRGRRVSGQDLGIMLQDYAPMRLAVLNACEGARSSRNDPFAGVAQSLVQQNLPAVIAMQFEITDRAAITFAQSFYRALSDSYPVDAALSEARKSIFAEGNDIEWGTPVLYLRATDGRIFNVAPASEAVPSPASDRVSTNVQKLEPAPVLAPPPVTPTPPAPLPSNRKLLGLFGGMVVLLILAVWLGWPRPPVSSKAVVVPSATPIETVTPRPPDTIPPPSAIVPVRIDLLQTIPVVGSYPNSIALDAEHGMLFVCLRNRNAVRQLDEKGLTYVRDIPVGTKPSHCTFFNNFILTLNVDPDPNSGTNPSLSVIDEAHPSDAQTMDLSAYGKGPSDLAVDPVVQRLYIPFHDSDQVVIFDISTLPIVKFIKQLPADRWPDVGPGATAGPYSLAGVPGLHRMYLSNRDRSHLIEIDTQGVDLLQPQTENFGSGPNVDGIPYFVAASPISNTNRSRVYLTYSAKERPADQPDMLTWYDVSIGGMIKGSHPRQVGNMGASGGWVSVDPRNGDVWVTANRQVLHLDRDLIEIDRYGLGIGPNPYSITINHALSRVYVTNGIGAPNDAIDVFGPP